MSLPDKVQELVSNIACCSWEDYVLWLFITIPNKITNGLFGYNYLQASFQQQSLSDLVMTWPNSKELHRDRAFNFWQTLVAIFGRMKAAVFYSDHLRDLLHCFLGVVYTLTTTKWQDYVPLQMKSTRVLWFYSLQASFQHNLCLT